MQMATMRQIVILSSIGLCTRLSKKLSKKLQQSCLHVLEMFPAKKRLYTCSVHIHMQCIEACKAAGQESAEVKPCASSLFCISVRIHGELHSWDRQRDRQTDLVRRAAAPQSSCPSGCPHPHSVSHHCCTPHKAQLGRQHLC